MMVSMSVCNKHKYFDAIGCEDPSEDSKKEDKEIDSKEKELMKKHIGMVRLLYL